MSAAVKQEIQVAPSAAISEGAALVQMIERAARDESVNVDKMRELLAIRREIAAEQALHAFNAAMTAAQTEMRPVAADASNPQTKSKYASYLALDRALRPIYTKHGFALSFNTAESAADGYVRVVCDVSHNAGHTKRYQIDMPADGKGAKGGDVMTKTHATGSAATYGTRYLLKMIFNIVVGDDDDGNAAGSGEKIMADQIEGLRSIIEEVGADEAKFCKYLKIERLEELPVARWNDAVRALEAKRRKA